MLDDNKGNNIHEPEQFQGYNPGIDKDLSSGESSQAEENKIKGEGFVMSGGENGSEIQNNDLSSAGASFTNAVYSQSSNDQTAGSEYRYGSKYYKEKPESSVYTAYQISDGVHQSSAAGSTSEQYQKPKKRGFGKTILKCACLALVFGIVAGFGFQAVNFAGDALIPENKERSADSGNSRSDSMEAGSKAKDTADTPGSSAGKADVLDASQIASDAMPSVVSITNMGTTEIGNYFGYGSVQQPSQSSGSGIIVGQNDTELLIATNNHVVAQTEKLTVTFCDDTTIPAQIKGTQPDSDLAVIAVNLQDISAETKDKIDIAVLGDSTMLKVGEPAIAIGNSLGYGQSVTAGVISALDREVTVDNVTNRLIQTDAAINPGNSGGALLNMRGEVIGINAVKYAEQGVEGMGYAIPMSNATPIINELMNKTTRAKIEVAESGYLGITGNDVSESVSAAYNMPRGVFVKEALEGSAAAKAGIRSGDIITKFDGSTVGSMAELQEKLMYYKAGETVEVVVQTANGSQYEERVLNVTLDKKTEDLIQQQEQQKQPPQIPQSPQSPQIPEWMIP